MRLASTFALILLAAASLPACSMSLSGSSVSERGGVLHMDDLPLPFQREVELTGTLDGNELRLSTHLGEIDVSGVSTGELSLVLVLHSEFEGDGEVSLEGGSLRTSSPFGGVVLLDGIRGTIPAGTRLHVQTGTGRIVVRDMTGESDLDIDSGTGAVFVSGGEFNTLRVDTGTGDVRLDSLRAQNVRLTTGTGRVAIDASHIESFRGDSGTGDFVFTDCDVGEADLNSGTGDVRLMDTLVDNLDSSLGTGDVSMERSSEY